MHTVITQSMPIIISIILVNRGSQPLSECLQNLQVILESFNCLDGKYGDAELPSLPTQ